jgi:D-glycero-alpha-D-manno-heptose 1-phosphate guanylyltransferase
MEAVVLAGGLGTRLRPIVRDVPKPMALINERPFLHYLLSSLSHFDVSRIILCIGYKHEVVERYFGASFLGIPITYSVEAEPLGTGGAAAQAVRFVMDPSFIVLNGDTYFEADIRRMNQLHEERNADCTMALKTMHDFDRYATITLDNDRVVSFEEKRFCAEGLINAGMYIVKKSIFETEEFPKKFSLEKDFLEKRVSSLKVFAMAFDGYFIDMGIPEDYERAQRELPGRAAC